MIVPRTTEPTATPPGFFTAERSMEIARIFGAVRRAPYKDDFKDDWTPGLKRDCQGKTAWMMEQLVTAGWPPDSLRGYVAEYRPWYARIGLPLWLRNKARLHAMMVARVTFHGKVADLYYDIRRSLPTQGLPPGYLRAWPAMVWEKA